MECTSDCESSQTSYLLATLKEAIDEIIRPYQVSAINHAEIWRNQSIQRIIQLDPLVLDCISLDFDSRCSGGRELINNVSPLLSGGLSHLNLILNEDNCAGAKQRDVSLYHWRIQFLELQQDLIRKESCHDMALGATNVPQLHLVISNKTGTIWSVEDRYVKWAADKGWA